MGPPPAVAAVRRAVRESIKDLSAGSLVVVGCSGGADSLALAGALAFVGPRAGLRGGALTVDHGLQPDSAERSRRVAEVCRDLGLDPVEVLPVQVHGEGGPEAAARKARYGALDAAAERLGAGAVLLGHTLDDQAETVLLGLARGSGGRSLAGMPSTAGRYRRPLLELRRSTTRAACAALGLEPWDDPHNIDPAYARSRVRHDAMPGLERALGPGVPEALARTARLLRQDADALDTWARAAYDRARRTTELDGPAATPEGLANESVSPAVALDIETLAGLPASVRGRVLHRAAIAAGSPSGALAAIHIEGADALLMRWRGQGGVDLPGGVRVVRRCGRLLFGEGVG